MLNRFYVVPRIGGVAYLNIGKAACSSVLLALSQMRNDDGFEPPRERLPDGSQAIHGFEPSHAHIDYFFRRWPLDYPALPSSFVRFSFVRNPYTRMLSFYRSKIAGGQKPGDYYEQFGIDRECSFDRCVRILTSLDPTELEHHIAPQASMLVVDSTPLVDFVGKVDEFDQTWPVVQRLTGFDVELEHANPSRPAAGAVYTEELKKRVFEYFKDDFFLFGFDRDSIETVESTETDTGGESTIPKKALPVFTKHRLPAKTRKSLRSKILASSERVTRMADAFEAESDLRAQFFAAQNETFRELCLKHSHQVETLVQEEASRRRALGERQTTFNETVSGISKRLTGQERRLKNLSAETTKVGKNLDEGLARDVERSEQLRSNVRELKNESAELRSDLSQLRTDVGGLRSHVEQHVNRGLDEFTRELVVLRRLTGQLRDRLDAAERTTGSTQQSLRKVESSLKYLGKQAWQTRNDVRAIKGLLGHHARAAYAATRGKLRSRIWRIVSRKVRKNVAQLSTMGGVDPVFYFGNYPDTISAGMSAAEHYVRFGASEGRNPSESFDTNQYLSEHPFLANSGENPLLHFLTTSARKRGNN